MERRAACSPAVLQYTLTGAVHLYSVAHMPKDDPEPPWQRHRPWWYHLASALSAVAIALAVSFAPWAIDEYRARRSAPAIRVVASQGESAHAQACRAPDDTSARFISGTRRMAAASDSAWVALRAELQLPRAESSAVVLLGDDATCRRVLDAFHSAMSTWPSDRPTSLYVAEVGATYVGMVPVPPDGSTWAYVVASTQFDVLSAFAK